jgi:hypothetical protein
MRLFTRLALFLCLLSAIPILAPSAFAAEVDARIIARLDALERENAALRARLNRIETSKAPTITQRAAGLEPTPALASAAQPVKAVAAVAPRRLHRFEVSGSLLYLQPGAGNLEYGTLTNPLPAVSPHWNNQSLKPNFSPAFAVGARYMIDGANDVAVRWTHLNASAKDSFFGTPDQMAGPPYLIGPESLAYKNGYGGVRSTYDSVSLDGGHTFCAECSFQFRVFAGVEFARIRRTLTGRFQSAIGDAYHAYANESSFTGAGPRFGMKSQYALGDFQLISEVAAAALIGNTTSRIDMTTVNANLAEPTNQYLASPKAVQVIPSLNGKLAAAYTFPSSNFGLFQIEAGYRAAVYFNAVSQYSMTQVPVNAPVIPPNGIYLATQQRVQNNYTDHGPFLTGNLKF